MAKFWTLNPKQAPVKWSLWSALIFSYLLLAILLWELLDEMYVYLNTGANLLTMILTAAFTVALYLVFLRPILSLLYKAKK